MATQLQIKRSTATGQTPTITYGELAYSTDGKATSAVSGGYLWVADSSNVARVIGGDHYVKMLDHTAGTLTANNAVVVGSDSKIDQLLTTNITVGGSNLTFGATADVIIPDSNASALEIKDATNTHMTFNSDANTVTLNSKVGGDIEFNPSASNITFDTTLNIKDQGGTPKTYLTFGSDTVTVGQNLDIGSNTLSMTGDISAASGTFAENDASIVVKNTTDEHANDTADTTIEMQDHAGNSLAQFYASHVGTANDAKGQLKISTGSDATIGGTNHAGTVAVTIDEAQKTTFAGHVDVGTSGTAKNLRVYGDLQVDGDTTTINTAQLTVEDDLITISKGNDTVAAANLSGIEIDVTTEGVDNIHWKYINANTAWQSNVDIDLATVAETLKIAGTDVLSHDTLGAGVANSTLTKVSALDSGSITSGFGAIDNGTDNITTGGQLKIDVDGATNAAGALTLGAGNDASLYFDGSATQLNSGVYPVAVTAGDVTMFDATASGSPTLSLGAAATDALKITATTNATSKLIGVTFDTPSTDTVASMDFSLDGTKKFGVTSTGVTVDGGTIGLPNSASIAESNTGDVTVTTPLTKSLKIATGDVTIFDSTATGGDLSLSMGTSATDALKIETLNQTSSTNLDIVHFNTFSADASTAHAGKMKFSVQSVAIMDIDDNGLKGYGDLANSGNSWTATAPHLDNFVIDGGTWS